MLLNNFKIMLALLGGVGGWLLGGFDSLIYALVAFVAIDYASGVLLAIYEKQVSSNIGFNGICRKVLIFALVALGNIIEIRARALYFLLFPIIFKYDLKSLHRLGCCIIFVIYPEIAHITWYTVHAGNRAADALVL